MDELRERILERIFGDFMGRADVRELEARLCGLAYERDVVAGALSAVNPTDYFGDVSRDDILSILHPLLPHQSHPHKLHAQQEIPTRIRGCSNRSVPWALRSHRCCCAGRGARI